MDDEVRSPLRTRCMVAEAGFPSAEENRSLALVDSQKILVKPALRCEFEETPTNAEVTTPDASLDRQAQGEDALATLEFSSEAECDFEWRHTSAICVIEGRGEGETDDESESESEPEDERFLAIPPSSPPARLMSAPAAVMEVDFPEQEVIPTVPREQIDVAFLWHELSQTHRKLHRLGRDYRILRGGMDPWFAKFVELWTHASNMHQWIANHASNISQMECSWGTIGELNNELKKVKEELAQVAQFRLTVDSQIASLHAWQISVGSEPSGSLALMVRRLERVEGELAQLQGHFATLETYCHQIADAQNQKLQRLEEREKVDQTLSRLRLRRPSPPG